MSLKYIEVKNIIKKMIKEGNPNDQITSERELTKITGASRMTIRRSIEELVSEGLLYRKKGKGTFIADTKYHKIVNNLTGFSQEMKEMGGKVETKVLSMDFTLADTTISEQYGVPIGTPLCKVVRLRLKDDIPMILDEAYFDAKLIPGLNPSIASDSIYSYIEDIVGLNIASSVQKFEAVFPPREYVDYLDVDPDEPIIKVHMIGFLDDGRPFEYTTSYKNAKKYELIIKASK
jgi:DNA-binding GntR family transcriptional regulator